MAIQSSLKNMAICLTLVCLSCSAILAGAYALTKDAADQAAIAKTNATIAKVLPEFTVNAVEGQISFEGTDYTYYSVEGVGYAILSTTVGFGGPLQVMVGITNEGIIHNSEVISHAETPGLGAKCVEANWRAQFKDWNPAEKTLTVKKDGGDVDAITASTITSRAYALALSNALKVYSELANNEGGNE